MAASIERETLDKRFGLDNNIYFPLKRALLDPGEKSDIASSGLSLRDLNVEIEKFNI